MASIAELQDGYRYNVESLISPPSHEVSYMLYDLANDSTSTVRAAAASLLPTTYDSIPLKSYSIEEQINNTRAKIRAVYQSPSFTPDSGDLLTEEISFDTGSETQHITIAIDTISTSANAPDLKEAIGYDGEQINGIDIQTGAFEFTVRKQYLESDVDSDFIDTLKDLAWHVNNATFNGFSAGELLFRGASGTISGGVYTITYSFAAKANQTGLTIGPFTNISVKGWEYIDVLYGDTVDDTNHALTRIPEHYYVLQVYPTGTFSDLGLTWSL